MDLARDGAGWPNREYSRLVDAGALRFHVQVAGPSSGEGPVLLLLHGTGASTHSWRGLLPLLAAHYTVVAPDLPGHAFTSRQPADRRSLPGMALSIADLLRAMQVRPDIVIGHSAGAAIGAQLCVDGHAAPAGLASINGVLQPMQGFPTFLFSPLAKLMTVTPWLPKLISRHALDAVAVQRLIDSTGSKLDAAGVAQYARLVQHPAHIAGVLDMMAGWDLGPLGRALPRLRPALRLLVGSADRTVPPAESRRVLQVLPAATLREFPGLGHLAHEEAPEAFAADLQAFALERLGAR